MPPPHFCWAGHITVRATIVRRSVHGGGPRISTRRSYPPILRCPSNIGLTRDEAPLARRADGRYEVDWEAFERAIHGRTRAFILCNPHNPTGRVYTREELTRMAEICARRGLSIIASLAPEVAARTITLMSPSKTFNLAGLKCAIAVVPDAALREKFLVTKVDLVANPNVFGFPR